MLVHSLALLAIYAKHSAPTRVLTITLVSLPALRPSRAGSKSTAHWPLRASFQVSLNPAQQAGRLCLRPSATPLLRTEEVAQPLACLFLLRVGFIILQSAATRAPLPTGSVLGHPGPSPPAGRGTTHPCRRLGPALTTTGQNVTLRSAHDHSCQRLLHSPPPPSNLLESGQRIFQAGVNVTRNRQEQGRGRFDVSMAWASTHTCLDNCLHSAERHASTPMLLS